MDTVDLPQIVPAGELTRDAVTNLRNRGLRLTPQRLLILELLEHASGHIAAEDIYQQVLKRFPMINRSTVYRTLDVLEALGFVRHSHVEDGAARYHLAGESRHVHLACHGCGEVIDVTDLGIASVLSQSLAERFGFQADLTHFPISGLCRGCAEAGP
ncbi:MAG TPA: Fur family transcriptional regulator [Chloroflexota bacterium]|nr:Fur family transcriptional regulator [Chloroflexota bacterium]